MLDCILFVVSLLEENTNDDDLTEGEENDRPSHARKPKIIGDGTCWSIHFIFYINSFADHGCSIIS